MTQLTCLCLDGIEIVCMFCFCDVGLFNLGCIGLLFCTCQTVFGGGGENREFQRIKFIFYGMNFKLYYDTFFSVY